LTIGTRGSELALFQTRFMKSLIEEKFPNAEIDIKIIKTKGDRIQDVSLEKIGDKGLFVKEIEEQLISGEIDLAVHSMKDMPSVLPEGLTLVGCPNRVDHRDCLVVKGQYKTLKDLPEDAVIGTGSKRRKYQLQELFPKFEFVDIRGNVRTRMDKIYSMDIDGTVLAKAGLDRLEIQSDERFTLIPLEMDQMISAPSQGALAIEIKEDRKDLVDLFDQLEDKPEVVLLSAERAFMSVIGGGCHIPIGAKATFKGDEIIIVGVLGDEEGNTLQKDMASIEVDCKDCYKTKKKVAMDLGAKLGKVLKERVNAYEG